MDILVTTPERTLMIGDTSYDMQMAKNASVQAVAVTFGAHSHDKLSSHNSIATFHQFDDLSAWLLEHA
jgi:phosphoglycolate phosphatase